MSALQISDHEFESFQKMLLGIAGISLSPAKKPLVAGRLSKRLRHHQLSSFHEYFKLIKSNRHPEELQIAVDLLTTNETYFFRESDHFRFLHQRAESAKQQRSPFRVWSAACSSGQEPYSIAMVLEDCLGNREWEVLASDISTQVLAKAQQGLYPTAEAENIPREFLSRYCLKGVGTQAGTLLVDKPVRQKVQFFQANLNTDLPRVGEFDIIFLRNVMIYFEQHTKRQVVQRLQACLKPGGVLITGHSETLNGINEELKMLSPSLFQKGSVSCQRQTL